MSNLTLSITNRSACCSRVTSVDVSAAASTSTQTVSCTRDKQSGTVAVKWCGRASGSTADDTAKPRRTLLARKYSLRSTKAENVSA
jgi:hypothetical protein